ncbi:hypothetical protein TWF481_009098 [Arthrobotrys musiformis]|uniref:Uncharacterized protein n=1 Tax=Arthrobotrys musiformis TaxID=47236 RepID=A0AAV9W4N1_9PEZI
MLFGEQYKHLWKELESEREKTKFLEAEVIRLTDLLRTHRYEADLPENENSGRRRQRTRVLEAEIVRLTKLGKIHRDENRRLGKDIHVLAQTVQTMLDPERERYLSKIAELEVRIRVLENENEVLEKQKGYVSFPQPTFSEIGEEEYSSGVDTQASDEESVVLDVNTNNPVGPEAVSTLGPEGDRPISTVGELRILGR